MPDPFEFLKKDPNAIEPGGGAPSPDAAPAESSGGGGIDPFAFLKQDPNAIEPGKKGGGYRDPFAFLQEPQGPEAPTGGMAPTAFPPQGVDKPIGGLPESIDLPFFGKTKTTDIPLAGFFLNQRMYQGPTEQEKSQYKPQKEEVYNPLLPLGIDQQVPSTTPVLGGIAEALGEAQKPTTPDYFSAGIRDVPILGELSRAGETAINLLGQTYKTIGEPLAGLVSIPARGLSKAGEGWEAVRSETQKAADEALARINSAGGLDRPQDMAQELGVLQEFGRSALAGTPAVYKFAAPMLFDPLTYAGGELSGAERAKLAAGATRDVAEISKMSPIERIIKTGFIRSPVSAEEVKKAGEMGVLSREALGMRPNSLLEEVNPINYTNRSKAMELLENSISGLLARSQFTDGNKTRELLETFAKAAKENSFQPIRDAFPDMEKAARSLEGQRIIRSLGELDVSKAQKVMTDLPDMVSEASAAIRGGFKFEPGKKPSPFAKDLIDSLQKEAKESKSDIVDVIRKRFGADTISDEQLAKTADEWAKYKMLADATESMGKAAIESFGIKPDERLAVKIRDTVKSIEANLFIGFSPTTVINNWGNNTVMQILHGLNPTGISKYSDRMWKAWKMEPGGEFRRIQEKALAQISRDTKSAGFAGLVKGKQFGPFLSMYSKMENGARHNIWAKGVEDYFKRAMRMSAEGMPDDVARALRAVDPSGALLDAVKGAVRSAFTPEDVMKFVSGKVPVTLESQLGSIARDLNITEDALSVFMHESEAWPLLNDALKQSKNADEFAKRGEAILNDLKTRIERAAKLQAETTGTAVPEHVSKPIADAAKPVAPTAPKIVKPVPAGTPAAIAPKPAAAAQAATGIIRSLDELKAQAIKFEGFQPDTSFVRVWEALLHYGDDPEAMKGVSRAITGWSKSGKLAEGVGKSFEKAGERGQTLADALTEFYQLRANFSYQAQFNPEISEARKVWYANNLRESDALIRTVNRGKKGLDFDVLEKGKTDPRLAYGAELGTEEKYVSKYYPGTTVSRPPTPPRGAGGGVQGTVPTSGAVRPPGGGEVPLPPGAGRAGGVGGAAPESKIKQLLSGETDAALQQWARATGPGSEEYANTARIILNERKGIIEPIARTPTEPPAAAAVAKPTTPGMPEPPPAPPEKIRPVKPGKVPEPPTIPQEVPGAPKLPPGTIEPIPRELPAGLRTAIEDLQDIAADNPAASGMQADQVVASRYNIVAQVMEKLYPRLEELYNASDRMGQATPETNAARQALKKWISGDIKDGNLTTQMTDARTAAARIGDWYVQRNILNYSARTNMDDWLSWAFPFAYWPRATASNYLMEALNRPMLITSYMRSKEALDKIQEDEGFPKRFKGAIPVPMPFAGMTPWLSGKMFFDPLKDWLPVDRFTTELPKTLGYLQPNTTDIAAEIRTQMQSGTLSQADGDAALKQQKGNKIWDSIEARMRQQQQPDLLDMGSLIFSPHFPLDWANKVMQGRPQDISYMVPMSRQIKGASAILGAAFPQLRLPAMLAGPEGIAGGIDPEAAIRQKLGLPAGDSTINYRIDRMLASMSLDGSADPEQARVAALERKGPVYDEAVRRASIETGVGSISGLFLFNSRVMAGGEQIAMNDAKQVSETLDSLVKQAGGDPVRMSYDEKKKLLKDTKGTDGKPLWNTVSQWYSDHPEYKPRLELFDTAEAKLSNWLSDGIWEKYLALSALDRRLFSSQNPDFKDKFASKETRQKPENIPNSTLEKWATLIGAYVPKMPSETPTSPATIDQVLAALQKQQNKPEQYRPQNPALAEKYDEWLGRYTTVSKTPEFQEYQKRLNAVSDVQTKYFDLPAGPERRAFLQQHPELNEYWAWSRNMKQNDPTLKDYFSWDTQFWKDNPELAKVLGRTPSTPAAAPYIPYAGGSSRGYSSGYTPRTFPVRKPSGGGGGGTSGEKPWSDLVNELGGPNTPLVAKIEAWLTLVPGEGDIYASKNPDLATWLGTKTQAYLDTLRKSYMYRLHHPPLTVQSKKGYSIRYLKPIK